MQRHNFRFYKRFLNGFMVLCAIALIGCAVGFFYSRGRREFIGAIYVLVVLSTIGVFLVTYVEHRLKHPEQKGMDIPSKITFTGAIVTFSEFIYLALIGRFGRGLLPGGTYLDMAIDFSPVVIIVAFGAIAAIVEANMGEREIEDDDPLGIKEKLEGKHGKH